MEIRILVASF